MKVRVHHPLLTVVASPDAALPVGTRLHLSRGVRAVVGRDSSCDLVVADSAVTRRHCALDWFPGEGASTLGTGWSVLDYGGSNGTFVNGQRVEQRSLAPGDAVTIGSTTLRFEDDASELEFSEEHEAAILDAPEDEGRWLVYADWLQERQNPYGAQMVAGGTRSPVLEGLASFVQASWRHGMITRAVVRRLVDRALQRTPEVSGIIGALFEEPASRLLQALELDLRAFPDEGGDLEALTAAALTALARARPVGLRSVRVGPLDTALVSPEVWSAFGALRAACPRLTTGWGELCHVPRREWLEVERVEGELDLTVGQQIPLHREQPWRLRRGTTSLHLHRMGAWRLQLVRELPGVTRFPVVGFSQGGPLWLRVNGEVCDSAFLRGGDVVELEAVVRFVFREE